MSTASDYRPNFDLTGSVMLVTGPARGLGRASTLACAAAGADIVLGLRDKGSDGGLAAEIEKMGRKVLPLQLDVTKMDQITDGGGRRRSTGSGASTSCSTMSELGRRTRRRR